MRHSHHKLEPVLSYCLHNDALLCLRMFLLTHMYPEIESLHNHLSQCLCNRYRSLYIYLYIYI